MNSRVAVIAGAGPAGLTAAAELLKETSVQPVIFELAKDVGGISKTVQYDGCRMDLGGHRFFSKSDWVMNWWQQILPVETNGDGPLTLTYQNKSRTLQPSVRSGPGNGDDVLLVRSRLSRIYYRGRFFDYPIKLNWDTVRNLGLRQMIKIGLSYTRSSLFPVRPEKSLEDFLINRFGRELYGTFFKEYTEKVWGLPCHEISADWGAQRIKGLSVTRAVWHALREVFGKGARGLQQKTTNTSLIQRFLYPKFGPGQMWRCVAARVVEQGARLQLEHRVEQVVLSGNRVEAVDVRNLKTGETQTVPCDYFFSTMPVRELIRSIRPAPPREVRRVARGLQYRDFLTVGLVVPALAPRPGTSAPHHLIPDNWIYVQDRGVRLGRIQIFNNWSPYLVERTDGASLGLEYFCEEDDELWSMPDDELAAFALSELRQIGFVEDDTVLASHVERVKKAYPGYFGTYPEFDRIRDYTDEIDNLFLIGRNGMHRYNNQDHSMLTARRAVEAVASKDASKDAIWEVNIDDEYHEEKPTE